MNGQGCCYKMTALECKDKFFHPQTICTSLMLHDFLIPCQVLNEYVEFLSYFGFVSVILYSIAAHETHLFREQRGRMDASILQWAELTPLLILRKSSKAPFCCFTQIQTTLFTPVESQILPQ